MYKYLLILPLVWALTGQAQAQSGTVPAPLLPADSLTRRIKFVGVVAVPGISAAELQARSREWVALTFQDTHQVTQLDDVSRGVLIVRGYTAMWKNVTLVGTGGNAVPLAFTFRLDFRDGRYRYEVSDLGYAFVPGFATNGYHASSSPEVSQQATADWQSGGLATVAASPRQELLQPAYAPDPRDYNLAKRYGRNWPECSGEIRKTIDLLLTSLRQYETAPAVKW